MHRLFFVFTCTCQGPLTYFRNTSAKGLEHSIIIYISITTVVQNNLDNTLENGRLHTLLQNLYNNDVCVCIQLPSTTVKQKLVGHHCLFDYPDSVNYQTSIEFTHQMKESHVLLLHHQWFICPPDGELVQHYRGCLSSMSDARFILNQSVYCEQSLILMAIDQQENACYLMQIGFKTSVCVAKQWVCCVFSLVRLNK